MDSKIAGTVSLLGPAALLGIWFTYLFAALPDCADPIQLALASMKYALSPDESGTWLFIYTLISIAICLGPVNTKFDTIGAWK